ncbi:MAG: S41 family peptidase [Prochloraceae cyanobacterium]|nr:S41 family peptidase [Prochloraceae cyanobacterium]
MNKIKKQLSSSPSPIKDKKKQVLLKKFTAKLLPLGFLFPLTVGYVLTPTVKDLVKASLSDSPKTIVDEVWQKVNTDYVDKEFNQVDWQQKRQELLSKEYISKESAYRAIKASLRELGDPYTRFLTPEEYESLNARTTGELSGIGIEMQFNPLNGDLEVVGTVENSPAEQAGIKVGDKIVSINGKPTSLMSLEQASAEVQGEIGTDVKLEISRKGQKPFESVVKRAQIELTSVTYKIRSEGRTKVGYIKLNEFNSHSAKQMNLAITNLKKKNVAGFVLDLRDNPGGLLFSSVDIARMWLDRGTIVYINDRKGGERKFSANNTALTDLPLVVLVDGNSASSSEILAGALQDNKRAKIVGTRTYGKGTVQSVHPLSDGSGLVLTISKYYPPSRVDINKYGIKPDIEQNLPADSQLNLTANPALFGTNADPQYLAALDLLK